MGETWLITKVPKNVLEITSISTVNDMTLELLNTQSKRRDKLVIITEIIGIAKNGTSKTHIMFKANLSFSQLNQYISLLLQSGLIEKVSHNNRQTYIATSKGLEFMEKQCEAIDMINESGLDSRKGVKAVPVILKSFLRF